MSVDVGGGRRQRGVALLTVMMIFGLATVLVRDMVLIGFTELRGGSGLRDSRQAYYYALGGEAYARELLWQDREADRDRDEEADGRSEDWALDGLEFDIDDGQLTIWISDLQGRFNLANLRSASGQADPLALARLRRLLDALGLDPGLAHRLADWVDEDGAAVERGGEDEAYRESASPQLVANVVPADLAELHSLAVLTESEYQALFPHLTSLPGPTRLNVNSASAEVLAALGGSPGAAGARAIRGRQESTTYASVASALAAQGLPQGDLAQWLTASSAWFEIEVLASYRERSARLRTVVYRDPASGSTRTLYRSQQSRLRAE